MFLFTKEGAAVSPIVSKCFPKFATMSRFPSLFPPSNGWKVDSLAEILL